jgi:hypothetical protein
MYRNLFAICATAGLVCACSAPTRLALPDGRTRGPVNSAAAIDDYITSLANGQARACENTQIARQLDAVKRDVAELRTYLTQVKVVSNVPRNPESAPSTFAAICNPSLAIRRDQPLAELGKPVETIKFGNRSITFRMSLDVGISEFIPSGWFEQELLKAAKEGQRIEIRSGSDDTTPSARNEIVARARAMNARKYLISNGVRADNSTLEGNAQNRRVDIEVIASDSSSVHKN